MTNRSDGGFLMEDRMDESEGLDPEGLSPVGPDVEGDCRVRRGYMFLQSCGSADVERRFVSVVMQNMDLYWLAREAGYEVVGWYCEEVALRGPETPCLG